MKMTLKIAIAMLLLATLLILIGTKVIRANRVIDQPIATKTAANVLPISNQKDVSSVEKTEAVSSMSNIKEVKKNDDKKSK